MTRRLAVFFLVLAACADEEKDSADPVSGGPPPVEATRETEGSAGDPDDPAIWIHPDDPALSLIIGTDKTFGLRVYDLEGRQVQELGAGRFNNVDVRGSFDFGDYTGGLAVATNRDYDTVAVYAIDPATRRLEPVTEDPHGLPTGIAGEVYGLCMYRSADATYVFLDSKDGDLLQLRLEAEGGYVRGVEVRRFVAVQTQPEGCVADDELGQLYLGEERRGVWKLDADPDGGETPTIVDEAGKGYLTADVEGMAIFAGAGGEGYLLVSSQGDSSYAVYRREGNNEPLGKFRIGPGAIDAAAESDGIEVTSQPLGAAFPYGMFIAHDTLNENFTGNFKMVPWERIAKVFDPPLDTAP